MINAMPDFRTLAGFSRRVFTVLLCLGEMAAVGPAVGQAFGQPAGPEGHFERCRAITDDAARLRCYEEATSKAVTSPPPQAPSKGIGTWRLVRTPNPTGGREAVSIMQTADMTKSDIDLAGLMLRCSDSHVEVLFVLVRPLPMRAHLKVTASAGDKSTDFVATVVPPGVTVLLPQEAIALATGPWQNASELSVQIGAVEGETLPTPIRGVVSLVGLGGALPLLMANCPSP
jgi:hypothetical protein